MIETVLAVLIVSAIFFGLFRLSRLLTGKILLEHAAMRVARARAVGFNDFMCCKAARVSVIPVAGKREQPDPNDPDNNSFGYAEELTRVKTYMESIDETKAQGLLKYKGWNKLTINPGDGRMSVVTMPVEGVRLEGKAGIKASASYYMAGGSQ